MRKLIFRLFALNYSFRLFGKDFNQLRASTVIFPLFILEMIAFWYNIDILKILIAIPLIISIFFGFVYFEIKPIKSNELFLLDKSQLNQYRIYKFNKEDDGTRDNILLLFINPLFIVLFVLIITL